MGAQIFRVVVIRKEQNQRHYTDFTFRTEGEAEAFVNAVLLADETLAADRSQYTRDPACRP